MHSSVQKWIALLLILQLPLGPIASQYPRAFADEKAEDTAPSSSSAEQEALSRINRLAHEVEASAGNDFPNEAPDPDSCHITGQKLITRNGSIHDLSSFHLTVPTQAMSDFNRQIQVRTEEDGSLALALVDKDGNTQARHVFSTVKPVAFAQDAPHERALLTIIDASGEILVMDNGYANQEIFKGPIPLFRIGTLEGKLPDSIQAAYVTRGLKPVLQKAGEEDSLITAKDLVIYWTDSAGKRERIQTLGRDEIEAELVIGKQILTGLVLTIFPDVSKKLGGQILESQSGETVQQRMQEEANRMNPASRQALLALTPDRLQLLVDRMRLYSKPDERARDQFFLQEWQRHYQKLQEQAQGDPAAAADLKQGDLSRYWQRYVEQNRESGSPATAQASSQLLTRSLKILAMLTAGGALAVEAHQLLMEIDPVWTVHIVNQLYHAHWLDPLKDPTYRWTLLKSYSQTLLIPLIYATGFLATKFMKKPDWSAVKGLMAISLRVYGTLTLLFYHRIAKLAGQRGLSRAMQLGVNPFIRVKPDSPLGRSLGLTQEASPGLMKPSLDRGDLDRQMQQNNRILGAVREQEARVKRQAWALALAVVAEDSGIDPVTLSLASGFSDDLIPRLAPQISQDPALMKKWYQLSRELQQTFLELNRNQLAQDLSKMNPAELAKYYQIAKNTAQKIWARSGARSAIVELDTQWREILHGCLWELSTCSLSAYETLRKSEPDEFIAEQAWKQFVTYFLQAIFQVSLFGPRADLSHPEALAAQEGHPFWTNPAQLAEDMGVANMKVISDPSKLLLTLPAKKAGGPTPYDPVESVSLKGPPRPEPFASGLQSWLKGAANLPEADYGGMWVRELSRRLRTFQASMVMTVLQRIYFAHQTFSQAFPAYLYSLAWSNWQITWLTTLIARGNQMYEERLKKTASGFARAKEELGQALRLNLSTEQVQRRYKDLRSYFQDSDLPGALLESEEALNASSFSPDAVQSLEDKALVEKLGKAIASGIPEQFGQADEALREEFRQRGPDHPQIRDLLSRLNALSLLRVQESPISTHSNSWVPWMTTGVGAVVTTEWGAQMSVFTYGHGLDWNQTLLDITIKSAIMYLSASYAQKAINRIWPKTWSAAMKGEGKYRCEAILSRPVKGPPPLH